ncbi:MAG: DUF5688 family protein [Lachnospiraceae bacterium]|nr:DUF5688 family protein [Lachnospiraceae bacterium]
MNNKTDLSYPEFKEAVLSDLMLRFPDGAIEVREVIKNNDTCLDGIFLTRPGKSITPQVYLQYFYQEYRNQEMEFNAVIDEIAAVLSRDIPDPKVDPNLLTNYSEIEGRIIYDLVNLPRNKAFLADLPYISYMDLAIIFRILINADENGRSSILIHQSHLKEWGVTKEELLQAARKNTPVLLPASIESITDVLGDLMPNGFEQPKDYTPIYVLSNQSRLNGASCMLYPHLLENFSRKMGTDFYIIPSSIHEILLIPSDIDGGTEELNAMVREVNHNELSEDEILSEHVYYFSSQKNAVSAG